MSFDTNGRTMMGITPEAAVDLFQRLPRRPVAFGANCGTGPGQLLATVLGLRDAAGADAVMVAKGNCGIPEYRDGHICYSGTPEIMAAYAGSRAMRCADHRWLLRHHAPSTSLPCVAALDEGSSGCGARHPHHRRRSGPVVLPSVTGASDAERERGERRRRRA